MRQKVVVGAKRKKAEDLPIMPINVNTLGITGTLPFSSGLMSKSKVLDDLPDFVKMEMEAMNKTPQVPEQAFTPPKPVDIDDLPPEKIAEVKESINKAISQLKQPMSKINTSIPGLSKAMKLADKAANYVPEPPKQDVLPETDSVIPGASVCSHCGWDLSITDNVVIERADKQLFVASVLGNKRFTKSFKLFGGQVTVVFRTPKITEADLVVKQLIKDWNDGKISGPAQSVAEAFRYQMYISLDAIDSAAGLIQLPELDDYSYDEEDVADGKTILPLVVEHVTETALTMEPLRRVITSTYGTFLATVAKLEAMSATASFWEATAN